MEKGKYLPARYLPNVQAFGTFAVVQTTTTAKNLPFAYCIVLEYSLKNTHHILLLSSSQDNKLSFLDLFI